MPIAIPGGQALCSIDIYTTIEDKQLISSMQCMHMPGAVVSNS